jgi:hypothetical protein
LEGLTRYRRWPARCALVAGSTCARLCPVARPVLCPSQIVRNLVVGPRPVTAPAPAGGLPGSRGTPTGGRRRAGGPGPPWSRSGRPSPTPQHRQPGTQRGLDRGPGPIGLPARKPLVDHLPRPIALGKSRHAPRYGPGTGCRSTPGVIPPTPSLRGVNRCQQRRQLRPLLVGVESSLHGRLLPHHLHPTQTHQRSEKHAL